MRTTSKSNNSATITSMLWKYSTITLILLAALICAPAVLQADTSVTGTISSDTTWTVANSPYIVTGNITVLGATSDGATLTIEAGVEVRFNSGKYIVVGASSGNPGALVAQGTAGTPIVFTSNQTTHTAGYWAGIQFYNTSDDTTSRLEYCTVEYAGTSSGQGIWMYNASPTITNCAISYSLGSGIKLTSSGSTPVISNNTISHCASYGVYNYSGGAATITGNQFSDNGNSDIYIDTFATSGTVITGNTINSGIYVGGGRTEFTGNTINYDDAHPLRLHPDDVGKFFNQNTISDITTDSYFEVRGGTISTDAQWPALMPFQILGNITVLGATSDGATLTIEAGVEVRFNSGKYMIVGASSGNPGALVAQGTAGTPIVFTSNQTTHTAGYWAGIQFYNTSDDTTSRLEYCTIEYAGTSSGQGIWMYNASPTITNCAISYSLGSGIKLTSSGSTPVISNNTISHCASYGVYNYSGGAASITGNQFSDNGNYDIYIDTFATSGSVITGNTVNSGIYVGGGRTEFTGNTINYDDAHPLRLHPDDAGEFFNQNTINNITTASYLDVRGGTISTDAQWLARMPVHILADILVQGTSGDDAITTLTIAPGAELRFASGCLLKAGDSSGDPGALVAAGTETSPIVFTADSDSPSAGFWDGIQFYNTTDDATSRLEHCTVEYAGTSSGQSISTYNASPTITNCAINYSLGSGIQFTSSGSTPVISNSTISHCTNYGIYSYSGGAATITGNQFSDNGNYDIYIYNASASGTVITGNTINSGIRVDQGSTVFTGNTINYDDAHPLRLHPDDVGEFFDQNTTTNIAADSYLEIIGGTIKTDAQWPALMSLHILNDILVQGTSGDDAITTLTISPGVELRFASIYGGCEFTVGDSSGDPGALVAVGTQEAPIVFTADSDAPTAGFWTGIKFYNTTDDATSRLGYCEVEYAGMGSGSSIYLVSASPAITRCIIRYSGNYGIRLAGDSAPLFNLNTIQYSGNYGLYASSTGTIITGIHCNTFTGNATGIYWTESPPPAMHRNNFSGNNGQGLYYSGTATLNAEDNWWNDAAGPNAGGDAMSGNVDADPWSLAENDCTVAEENLPPYTPSEPAPASGEVKVSASEGTVSLSWTGGDPNVLDLLTYDLYWGETVDTLALEAQGVVQLSYTKNEVPTGTTLYWQIIAKDDKGLETAGPVWHFTTDGDQPDLIITELATTPGGHMVAGDSVTLTAVVRNIGSGPAVAPFVVDFLADSATIGSPAVDAVILPGQSVSVSQTWAYGGGDPSLEIAADSGSAVSETSEENNQYIALLSEVADITPPSLVATSPSQGAFVQEAPQITVTLADSQSALDGAAVMAGFTLTDSSLNAVSGTVGQSGDSFTFTPAIPPLADDLYTVTLNAADTWGNSQTMTFNFTVDTVPPAAPEITGGTVASGTIQVRPVQNTANQFSFELTGTRDSGTTVWVNNVALVALGDNDWSVSLALEPGDNALEVWLVDAAGNQGPSVWVDIAIATVTGVTFEYDAAGRVRRIANPDE